MDAAFVCLSVCVCLSVSVYVSVCVRACSLTGQIVFYVSHVSLDVLSIQFLFWYCETGPVRVCFLPCSSSIL